MEYNKLVRDKIPEILADKGMKVVFRSLSDEEMKTALAHKLLEEVEELLMSDTIDEAVEELADVYEVLDAIKLSMPFIGLGDRVSMMLKKKREEKGAFYKHYFLISAEEAENG